jgi:hypothetical protein
MEIKRSSQMGIGNHEVDSNSKEVKVNPKISRGVATAIDTFQNSATDGSTNTMTSGGGSSSSNSDVHRYRLQTTTENSSSNKQNNDSSSFSEPQKTASKAARNLGYHPYQVISEERSKRK